MSIILSSYIASRALYNILCPEILFKSITALTGSLLTGIYNLISITKDTELQDIILSSDIIHDITVIKSFIESINKRDHNKTIIECINNINETLQQLENTINSITNKFELHKKLWFSYFRSYDITSEKNTLKFLSNQLKHRFNILIKISTTLK